MIRYLQVLEIYRTTDNGMKASIEINTMWYIISRYRRVFTCSRVNKVYTTIKNYIMFRNQIY